MMRGWSTAHGLWCVAARSNETHADWHELCAQPTTHHDKEHDATPRGSQQGRARTREDLFP
eukprot:scaffold267808_cov25-Tisochrysis_lutea.AAC.1